MFKFFLAALAAVIAYVCSHSLIVALFVGLATGVLWYVLICGAALWYMHYLLKAGRS